MVKFATMRSGSRVLVWREAWKSLVVPKLMYDGGALVWTAHEVSEMERLQTEMMRFAWRVGRSVSAAVVRGETGYSSF